MEDRLEIWLELLAGKLDRLIELGENVERASRSHEMPEEWGEHEGDHFAGADKMVSEEPAKEQAKHPAWPKPDPGEGYRILSKDPPEELQEGDEVFHPIPGIWMNSSYAMLGYTVQDAGCWYRRKIEPVEPAWEPKVGDWVRVTRPGDWTEWEHPNWEGSMNQFDEKIGKIECEWGDCFQICGFAAPNGFRYQFHRDWLSPAEPPASEKPAEPEYREPVLPADAGQYCQFSDDGIHWRSGWLNGWVPSGRQWISQSGGYWRHCRIKKDA